MGSLKSHRKQTPYNTTRILIEYSRLLLWLEQTRLNLERHLNYSTQMEMVLLQWRNLRVLFPRSGETCQKQKQLLTSSLRTLMAIWQLTLPNSANFGRLSMVQRRLRSEKNLENWMLTRVVLSQKMRC